jgi:hypothetical protein
MLEYLFLFFCYLHLFITSMMSDFKDPVLVSCVLY